METEGIHRSRAPRRSQYPHAKAEVRKHAVISGQRALERSARLGAPSRASAVDRAGGTSDLHLSTEEKRQLQALKARDHEVRAHERAHKATGGAHAVGPTYTFKAGVDGKLYAVHGKVRIDVSEVPGSPHATIRKMQQVRRAALAPAHPSAQDRAVAAKASQKLREAEAALHAQVAGRRDGAIGKGNPRAAPDIGKLISLIL